MKRDALNHPKMLDFASRLDISRAEAIGIITLLFDFTAQYATQGDLGKHRDGAIARACEWMADPATFVENLVQAGWVDRSDSARLLIHDWPDHCEQWVKLKLQKLKLDFHAAYSTVAIAEPIAVASTERPAELSASRDPAQPSLAKPSLSSPIPNQAPAMATENGLVAGDEFENFDLVKVDQDDCLRECLKLADAFVKKRICIDSDTIWRWGWLAIALDQFGLLAEVATKVREGAIKKPKAYIEASLRRACNEREKDLIEVSRCVPVRPRSNERGK